jgi:glucose/arabinose dehydrogenase
MVHRRRVHPTSAAPFVLAVAAAVWPSAAHAQLRGELVASGFTQSVAFVQDPTDASVFLVVQQDGRVRVVQNGVVQAADYLDLRGVVLNSGEQGLLGLAFAPDYATSGRVFVNFVNQAGHTVVARFVRSASNPRRAEPSSRFDLMWPGGQRQIVQPFSNHNGGNLVFGPDGYLYIGLGDGGSGNDPFHNAQNPQTLLGKMLRLDVGVPDGDPEGYNVPPTNPFVGTAGVLGEIWSVGLRNPWRYSFDNPGRGGTGALILGDVGQGAWEEIDYEPAGRGGRNYGWRNREGAHNNVTNLPPFSTPLIDPIHEYPHGAGASVTGGFVYRGTELGLGTRGRYFFADFVQSRIWSVRLSVNAFSGEATASDLIEHTAELNVGSAMRLPSSFGEDANGEIYVVSYLGTVHRLAGTGPPESSGAKRRPPGQAPIGFATPRTPGSNAGVAGSQIRQTSGLASAAPDPCAALTRLFDAIRELLPPEQSESVVTITLEATGSTSAQDLWTRLALLACRPDSDGGRVFRLRRWLRRTTEALAEVVRPGS